MMTTADSQVVFVDNGALEAHQRIAMTLRF